MINIVALDGDSPLCFSLRVGAVDFMGEEILEVKLFPHSFYTRKRVCTRSHGYWVRKAGILNNEFYILPIGLCKECKYSVDDWDILSTSISRELI